MKKQITIVALLFLALLKASFPASAQTCAMAVVAQTVNCSTDCCAKMKSCVLPQQNPAQRSAIPTAPQQSVAVIAAAGQELVSPPFAQPFPPAEFLAAAAPGHSLSPLQRFCSFLI